TGGIQALLDADADVMARDKYGSTPLHTGAASVYSSFSASIPVFLAAGADVTAQSLTGNTPLHSAASSGTPEVIQALLDAGADAKAKNKEGKTPWDLAQNNKDLKDTKAYWALNDAQYN
ncbi:ankyrin repeat domain-containing protein, partial [Paracoccaceae bacterium]|nr:ankyrin repeat domain-containing protein [Paracoccaceae bacterium]